MKLKYTLINDDINQHVAIKQIASNAKYFARSAVFWNLNLLNVNLRGIFQQNFTERWLFAQDISDFDIFYLDNLGTGESEDQLKWNLLEIVLYIFYILPST